ncbi:MAG TPA: GNAT family N-acetyltransferase [Actinomycetota bacterium]|nr:GNAT family N-acetyltransferase [Actinomycetota bacterium]
MTERARILEFLRSFDVACATAAEPWRFGTAFWRDDMPRVYDLNFALLEAPGDVTAHAVARAADDAHARRGVRHRKVSVRDERGERLRPAFVALGWDTERDVVMVLRAPPPSGRRRGEEVELADVLAMREAALRAYPFASDEDVVRQLVDKDRVFHDARAARHFAARRDDGAVVASCDLYSDGRTGQIEDVGTLEGHRGQGHATAVVLAAVDASLAAGHDVTFLVADDEDWPKQMYARLGFEPVAHLYDFWRSGE